MSKYRHDDRGQVLHKFLHLFVRKMVIDIGERNARRFRHENIFIPELVIGIRIVMKDGGYRHIRMRPKIVDRCYFRFDFESWHESPSDSSDDFTAVDEMNEKRLVERP